MFNVNANVMDDYRNLPPERILSVPCKEAVLERFMAVSDDRLSSQIFHVNFYYISYALFLGTHIFRILSTWPLAHCKYLSNKFLSYRTATMVLTQS